MKLCLQEAGGLKLPLSTDPCLAVSQPQCGISPRFDLGSVTRGNPPLGSRQVRLWSPWSQWLKVKGYRERVRKINLVKCCHARRNHTETLGRWENATRSRCTETHWLHGNRFVFCFFLFFYFLWPVNSYKSASVWLLDLQFHTSQTHNTPPAHFIAVQSINQQPSLTFVRTAELFTPWFVPYRCSTQRCQNETLSLSHIYISFPPLLSLADFSQALNYSPLASASHCLPLTNLLQWDSEFLLVFAAPCQSLQTPLICASVPGGCWINRMPTEWVRPLW